MGGAFYEYIITDLGISASAQNKPLETVNEIS